MTVYIKLVTINGDRVVNFAMSNNLIVKSTIFPQRTLINELGLSSWENTHPD
jgi:hypothetical protein